MHALGQFTRMHAYLTSMTDIPANQYAVTVLPFRHFISSITKSQQSMRILAVLFYSFFLFIKRTDSNKGFPIPADQAITQ